MLNSIDLAILQLPVVLATKASWLTGFSNSAIGIFQVALGLGFVIFVHELGHFLAAKFFGVKCEKFYVGFDVPIRIGSIRLPSSLGKFRWGETEYGIGIIPLGGYVKMLGQDDDPRKAEEEAARIRKEGGDGEPQYDPRSFPAKPVYARMIIISAGVVMNLIFAVLMAAYAFRGGVPYQPTIVGGVIPGDPAWQMGLQPGDQVLQVGGMTEPDSKLQYSDMVEQVAIAGLSDEKKPIPIKLLRDGQEMGLEVEGTKRHDPRGIQTMIGLQFARTTQLNLDGDLLAVQITDPDAVIPAFENGDRIVSVDGVPLAIDERIGVPTDYSMWSLIHSKNDSPVTLGIERTQGKGKSKKVESTEVILPPAPLKTLGLLFGELEVAAIQKESPCEKAGVKVGDRLVEFDGKPVEDGITLHLAVLRMVGKEAKAKLVRQDGQSYELVWNVPAQPRVDEIGLQLSPVGYELYGAGLTYTIIPKITGIVPGSPATQSDLQVGDTVSQVSLTPNAEQKKKILTGFRKEILEPATIDKDHSIVWMNELMQSLPVGTPIKIDITRDKIYKDATIPLQSTDTWHWTDRGLLLEAATLTYRTESATEALALGVKETWKRMQSVFKFLKLLVTGRVPAKAVGGPGMIFYQASSAASEGVSKLLMFLVMLSANLAIINFLPIPALDGGHMMFLIVEAARGKRVDEELQAKLTMLGVLGLLALMVFVIFNDTLTLGRLFGW